MPSVTIRHVPDETRDELAARAARAGQSLQEHLLAALVELARRPDVGTLLAQARQRKHDLNTSLSAAEIVSHRDSDRR